MNSIALCSEANKQTALLCLKALTVPELPILAFKKSLTNPKPIKQKWHEQSKPPASPPVARPLASSSLPRPLASQHPRPVVSRSLTVIALVLSLSVKSVATRSRLSSSSASFLSRDLFVRSLRTSRPTCDSNRRQSSLFRNHQRPTSSRCSKTPTWLPSTPSVSPSSPRTSRLHVVSVANALKEASRALSGLSDQCEKVLRARARHTLQLAITLRLSLLSSITCTVGTTRVFLESD
ncbi:hypothetical protein E5Q_02668 [Mixia osmundae IAM 14324]|uniref:Uncharacterized protein n=1 Tax=Mixia osmundae (strain CBS 9802 / IAM 14324 / JCM 22182 / KY 12970) TaxID=764103 RepID=G7DZJ8_MIXOS|nr:hypothetical protein E5Q_02668 [Mixia osmundae IAM 14324]